MSIPTPDSGGWSAHVTNLRNKAAEFEREFAKITDAKIDRNLYPDLFNFQQSLISRGNVIKTTVTNVLSTVESGYNTVKNWVGLDGINELGLIPLLPIAALTGALAVMTKWLRDAYIFQKKIGMIKSLQKQGYSAERAIKTVNDIDKKRALFDLGRGLSLLPWVVVGGAAWVFYRKGRSL